MPNVLIDDRPAVTRQDGGRGGWAAVFAVAVGISSLMTSELLPVGLLTPVGSDLDVSEGTAGLMVTAPGLVAAFSAPLLTVAAGRFDRRIVLVALIALVGAANLVSAFATNFATVLVARLLIGISVGGFWAVAGSLALRLVPADQVARATAVVFGGVSTASVLGVPAGTWLGELAGWRVAFGAVGVLGLLALVGLLTLLPPLPAERTPALADLGTLLRTNRGVRVGLAATFLLITGQFVAYTFVRPVLQDVTGTGGGSVGALLLVYGIAGVVGNFAAGSVASRGVRRALLGVAGGLAAALVLIAAIGSAGHPWATAAPLLVLWGLAYGAVPVCLQTWILKSAPAEGEAASSLFVAVFNLSIALGALLGGFAVEGIATAAVLWLGGALVLATALAVGTAAEPADA
ncbi:MFS transporter [Yinghuangia soli]|uniref:MFS transporter n=1 Tax=Yinghuangia soli TaxID=2908204 RepID=A0AA41Q067_9ACTN|nr:MFS transporter [Yinghuangia soli]MCF2528351.1 MFS transporter [Yinghuangia soli]